MAGLPMIALGGLAAAVTYFAVRLFLHRRRYHYLPGPPHSWIWGHLRLMGEYTERMPPDTYPMTAMAEMKLDFNLPDVFYLDLWPVGPHFIILSGPDSVAIPTTANSWPQSGLVGEFLANSIGTNFIESSNGPLWKELHQMMAPGLTPAAVKGYSPFILDQALSLYRTLRKLTSSGRVVDITDVIAAYPFAVMQKILFGDGFFSETDSARHFEILRTGTQFMTDNWSNNPIKKYFSGRETSKHFGLVKKEIGEAARSRLAELQKLKVLPTRTTATTIIDRMLLANAESGKPLDRRLETLIMVNGVGLMAAGYQTTADTLSYMCMLMGAFPEKLARVREEHDRVFGPDFDETVKRLKENPSLLNELPYTTAFMQEVMRFFPIGAFVRSPPPGTTSIECNGTIYTLPKGCDASITVQAMHLSPKVWDKPKEFRPERFLDPSPSFPRGAWRPFERGLRSCMGQTLAMEEMRTFMVMTARWFDFELRDHDPVEKPTMAHTDLDTKIGRHAFMGVKIAAGPHGPVMMRVHAAR